MLQNITKCYKKCYKSKFVTLLIILCLCGCAKKEPSTVLTEATQKEIVQLQEDIKKSTCENKDVFISKLNSISTEVKSIDNMCKLRYSELKQENSKLKIIMAFLVLIFLSTIAIIKRR